MAPFLVGLRGVEPLTSPLSGVRSNQLSYRPMRSLPNKIVCASVSWILFKGGDPTAGSPTVTLLRLHPSHRPHRGKRPPKLSYLLLVQQTPMV